MCPHSVNEYRHGCNRHVLPQCKRPCYHCGMSDDVHHVITIIESDCPLSVTRSRSALTVSIDPEVPSQCQSISTCLQLPSQSQSISIFCHTTCITVIVSFGVAFRTTMHSKNRTAQWHRQYKWYCQLHNHTLTALLMRLVSLTQLTFFISAFLQRKLAHRLNSVGTDGVDDSLVLMFSERLFSHLA